MRVRGCGLGISPLAHRDGGEAGGQWREAEETSWATCSLSGRRVMGIQGLGTRVPPDHGSHLCPTQAVAPQASELSQLNLCPLSLNEGLMTSRRL